MGNLPDRPSGSLPDRLGRSDRALTRMAIGFSAVATIACVGALSFYGGGGFLAGLGGVGTASTPPNPPPNTPTLEAFVVGPAGDSLRLVSSAFNGNGGSHDSTHFQVDSAGKDFSASQYRDAIFGAILTDTVTLIDSSAVVVSRVRHRSDNGEWSAWSDSLSTTMAVPVSGAAPTFATDWAALTGSSVAALMDSASATPWSNNDMKNADLIDVVTKATAAADGCGDFPATMDNVLRVSYTDRVPPDSTTHMLVHNVSPHASVGDTVFLRKYVCVTGEIGQVVAPNHWLHWGTIAGDYLAWWAQEPSVALTADSLMDVWHTYLPSTMTYDVYVHVDGEKIDEVYRRELAMIVESSTQVRFLIRVYDSDDVLIHSGTNYRGAYGQPGADSVGVNSATLNFTLTDACNFELGNNDDGHQVSGPHRYVGGFFCRIGGGWPGAYVAGEAN